MNDASAPNTPSAANIRNTTNSEPSSQSSASTSSRRDAAGQSSRLGPGQPAPNLMVSFADGTSSTLEQCWREHRLLLAFTRHLGCAFCREQLLDLKARQTQLDEANIEVIAVMMKSAEVTREFQQKLNLPFRCIADPDREVYRAFGAERGTLWNILGIPVWARAIQATWRGGMGMPKGDILQLHASILIDTQGLVQFAHYPKRSSEQLAVAKNILNQTPT